MFLANFASSKMMLSFSTSQIKQNDYLSFSSTVDSFDYCFGRVNDIFNILDSIVKLGGGHIDAYNLKNDLLKICVIDDFIDEIVVYYGDEDLIVSSAGTSQFNVFFGSMYGSVQYPAGFWRGIIDSRHSTKIIPASYYNYSYDNDRVITKHLICVAGSNQLNGQDNRFIFIDVIKLLSKAGYVNNGVDSSLVILDNQNNIIMSTDSGIDMEKIKAFYDCPNNTTEVFGKYEYRCILSANNGFRYIRKTLLEPEIISSTARTNLILLVISAIIGTIITLFLTHGMVKPVKKISADLEKANLNIRRDLQDVEIIKAFTGFYRITSENVPLLIDGGANFCLIAFDIYISEDCGKNFANILLNTASEIELLLCESFDLFRIFKETSFKFIAVIECKEPEGRAEILKKAEAVSKRLNESDSYGVRLNVSDFYSGDYRSAYNDIKELRAYRSILLEKGTADIKKLIIPEEPMYFPDGFGDKLISLTIGGNIKDCLCEIYSILDKNLERGLYYEKFVDVCRLIMNSFTAALRHCGCSRETVLEIEKMFFSDETEMSGFTAIKLMFSDIVEYADGFKTEKAREKFDKAFIVKYINLHYMEDLYLENMAETFETTPKYFSKVFKKEFDISFIEFLTNIRINHAKQYLKKGDIPINEIGGKVGYANSSTFASVFKKITGMSPTQYRESARKNP